MIPVEEIVGRWDSMSKRDVRATFGEVVTLIPILQEELRRKDPNNLLLGLVKISGNKPESAHLKFSDNYRAMLREYTDTPKEVSIYGSLGYYALALISEKENLAYHRVNTISHQ